MLTIYKVDPPGDPLEVRLLDDLDKLIDGPLAVDVLDVAFVLLDKAVQGFGVEPHGVVHVTAVLVGMAGIKRSVVKLLLQIIPPFTNILSWKINEGKYIKLPCLSFEERGLRLLDWKLP